MGSHLLQAYWFPCSEYTPETQLWKSTPVVAAARNTVHSMEVASSLEPVLFQSCLAHLTFHICLSMRIILKPPSKHQMSNHTKRFVHWCQVFSITLAFAEDGKLASPGPLPFCLMPACSCRWDWNIIQIIGVNLRKSIVDALNPVLH